MNTSFNSAHVASVLGAFHLPDQAVILILSEFLAAMELSQPEEAEKLRFFSRLHTDLVKNVLEDAIMDATLCAILENDDEFEACIQCREDRGYLINRDAFNLYGKMFWVSVMEREGAIRVTFPGTQEEILKRRAQLMSNRLNAKKRQLIFESRESNKTSC